MIFLVAVIFILGSAVGSFLNVVIDRSVRKESFVFGRSYCDHCHATLKALDLVPIASFAARGARCRYCRRNLSWQYPIVESLTGFLFAAAFFNLAAKGSLQGATLLLYLFLLSIFVVVSTIDIKFSLIPTTLVFLASFVVLFYNYFFLTSSEFVISTLTAFSLALSFVFLIVITRGRGMGSGDVPLVFLIGLILSWPLSAVSMFLSFLTGALLSIGLLVLGKKKLGQTVPFAPFLALGVVLSMFFGQTILNWYLSVLY